MNRLVLMLAIVVLFLPQACTPRESRINRGADANQNQQASVSGPEKDVSTEPDRNVQAYGDFPFSLTIGGQAVGSDRRVSVPESQGVAIQIQSRGGSASSGQMRVIEAKGNVRELGTWQATSVQFYYGFPYGENHLIVSLGKSEYDFLVVAGVPFPSEEPAIGCSGGYMDLNQGAIWNYEETNNKDYPEYWVYKAKSWSETDTGEVQLTIGIEGSTGVEKRVDRNATLDLICSKGTVFVTHGSEIFLNPRTEITTTYDKNTIYMPPILVKGTEWQRQGIRHVKVGEEEGTTYHVLEKFICVGKEKVTTKAGEFEADKVEYSINTTSSGKEITRKGVTWYVPGLGRVLSVGEMEGSPRMELTSFEGVAVKKQGTGQ